MLPLDTSLALLTDPYAKLCCSTDSVTVCGDGDGVIAEYEGDGEGNGSIDDA